MKTFSTFVIVSIFLLFSGSLYLTSCSESNAKSQHKNDSRAATSSFEIPALLERNGKIGTEAEQEYMQTSYDKLKTEITKKPESTEAYLKMAQVYMVEARATGEHGYYYPAALSMLDQVLSMEIKDAVKFQALSLKASVTLSLHEFAKARELATQAVAITPYNAQIHGALVDANVELGDYKEAVRMSDKMISIRPDLRSYSRVAYLREIHGEVEGSYQAMEMAIKAALPGSEESAWCYYTLANMYETYGELDKATQVYDAILEQRKNYPFAIAGLASVAAKKKDYTKASSLLDEACAIIPEVGFYEQKAAIYQVLGDDKNLKKTTKEIIEMLEDDEAHGHKMGLAYSEVYLNLDHDYKKAQKYALDEYNARPANIDVNKQMAVVSIKLGEMEKAAAYLKVARTTNAKYPELDYIEAVILANQGKKAEAKKMIKAAQKVNPDMGHALGQEVDKVLNS